ncbi:hypothetical protein NDU88_002356 [Pleurodeles waltl]|uniref:Uncharacterized protein n=1 Tax=Pleurodeles waltl TaxID=8319 RepID=A0AAV7VCA1_PLEWA|nr:hypothetical protein NDU88_002356 [Pleurodeles waltl]
MPLERFAQKQEKEPAPFLLGGEVLSASLPDVGIHSAAAHVRAVRLLDPWAPSADVDGGSYRETLQGRYSSRRPPCWKPASSFFAARPQ